MPEESYYEKLRKTVNWDIVDIHSCTWVCRSGHFIPEADLDHELLRACPVCLELGERDETIRKLKESLALLSEAMMISQAEDKDTK